MRMLYTTDSLSVVLNQYSIVWNLLELQHLRLLWTCRIRITGSGPTNLTVLTNPLGDSDIYSSMRTTV